ncbi:YbhB/YbcL family Raf kinase inhibitor-like protein [Candidatus Uhrbacteria bacterium]|nr:YbhB/YbcL family Raf kinase inhibitor-like protein [Candidatus Uhrbacteria bacterium]
MYLQSVDFKSNGSIPVLHTCDGASVSPHLEWGGLPKGTQSLAVSCFDPDSPSGTFAHWLIVNIPPTLPEVAQGGRTGGQELVNDFGARGYGGPCPPKGTHRYVFTLYALDVERLEGVTRERFAEHVEKHVIERTELIGKYRRK